MGREAKVRRTAPKWGTRTPTPSKVWSTADLQKHLLPSPKEGKKDGQ